MVKKYSILLRILHWLMAALIIGLIIMGFSMSSADSVIKPTLYTLHKATGITVLGLVILRLIIRFRSNIPPIPNNSSFILNIIARFVHFTLYLLMLIMPISGYIMSSASQRSFNWFFNMKVPLLLDKNEEMASLAYSMHVTTAYVLVSFILLHLLGALKHIFINKENILKRIW